MDIRTIVQNGDSVLRKKASEVAPELIGGKTLNADIKAMQDTLSQEYLGVAIAAPQIGISKRMFIVSGRVFGDEKDSGSSLDMVCINPEIIKTSKKTVLMDEGCLSVKNFFGSVKRHTNITFSYIDEDGAKHTRGAGGLLAHIVQHEIDHLDGILFIDKAQNIEELTGKDKKELERREQEHKQSFND